MSLRNQDVDSLLPHQEAGVRFLMDHPRCLLLDEPGLGKTIQALGLMAELCAAGELGRVLVATDSTMLARQWVGESAVWLPNVPAIAATDNGAFPRFQKTEGPVVLVATYDLIRSRRDWMAGWPWSLVVLDEVSVLKGGKVNHEAAREVSRIARRCVGLTATPLENVACDTWAVLDAVGTPEVWAKPTFDERFVTWKDGYKLPGTCLWVPRQPDGLREENLPELLSYLARHTLSRSAEEAELSLPIRTGPDVVWVQPTASQGAALSAADKVRDSRRRHHKRAAASAFAGGTSAKALAAAECIVSNPQHAKILVYAENLEHLDIAGRLLESRGIGYVRIEGKITPKKRQELLTQFETDPDVRVLLGSSVLERGLNLQCASALYSLGCSWNPARERQREGRVCRIGSRHATFEHRTFLLDHAQDRKRWQTLQRKDGDASKLH